MEKSNFLLAVTESFHLRTLYVTLIYFWKQSLKTAFLINDIHAYMHMGRRHVIHVNVALLQQCFLPANRIVKLVFVIRLWHFRVMQTKGVVTRNSKKFHRHLKSIYVCIHLCIYKTRLNYKHWKLRASTWIRSTEGICKYVFFNRWHLLTDILILS